jgi:hypothetical protein
LRRLPIPHNEPTIIKEITTIAIKLFNMIRIYYYYLNVTILKP